MTDKVYVPAETVRASSIPDLKARVEEIAAARKPPAVRAAEQALREDSARRRAGEGITVSVVAKPKLALPAPKGD